MPGSTPQSGEPSERHSAAGFSHDLTPEPTARGFFCEQESAEHNDATLHQRILTARPQPFRPFDDLDDEQLLHWATINNFGQNLWRARDLKDKPAMKNCYQPPGEQQPLPQNDAAVGTTDQPLTHRIPVSFNGDRLFRGRTA
jgi:hypothetical protein